MAVQLSPSGLHQKVVGDCVGHTDGSWGLVWSVECGVCMQRAIYHFTVPI